VVNEANARVALEQDTNNVGSSLLLIPLHTKTKCLVYSNIILLVRPAVQEKLSLLD